LDFVEKLRELFLKLNESKEILEEASRWHEYLNEALTAEARSTAKVCCETMRFRAGPNTSLCICEHLGHVLVRVEVDSNITIPDELKVPIAYTNFQMRSLFGLKEFIDNIENVVREIDMKIAEIEEKNEKLRQILERIREVFSPLVIAQKLTE